MSVLWLLRVVAMVLLILGADTAPNAIMGLVFAICIVIGLLWAFIWVGKAFT